MRKILPEVFWALAVLLAAGTVRLLLAQYRVSRASAPPPTTATFKSLVYAAPPSYLWIQIKWGPGKDDFVRPQISSTTSITENGRLAPKSALCPTPTGPNCGNVWVVVTGFYYGSLGIATRFYATKIVILPEGSVGSANPPPAYSGYHPPVYNGYHPPAAKYSPPAAQTGQAPPSGQTALTGTIQALRPGYFELGVAGRAPLWVREFGARIEQSGRLIGPNLLRVGETVEVQGSAVGAQLWATQISVLPPSSAASHPAQGARMVTRAITSPTQAPVSAPKYAFKPMHPPLNLGPAPGAGSQVSTPPTTPMAQSAYQPNLSKTGALSPAAEAAKHAPPRGTQGPCPVILASGPPSIAAVSPPAPLPGSTVDVTGCYFGDQATVQLTQTAQLATQNGYRNSEPITSPALTPQNTGSSQTVSFTLPASTAAGGYTLTVTRTGDGKSSMGVTVTVGAASSASSSSVAGSAEFSMCSQQESITPVRVFNSQTHQWSDPKGPMFNDSCGYPSGVGANGAVTACVANSYPAPQSPNVLESMTTLTAVPVQFEHPESKLEIWRDNQPVTSAGSDGAAMMSPDGNAGQWVQLGPARRIASCGDGLDSMTNTYLNASLSPGVNYVSTSYIVSAYMSGYGKDFTETINGVNYPDDIRGMYREVFVPPIYSATLDAVPYTIIYQPPGDYSSTFLNQSVTKAVQYSVGQSMQVSNSQSDTQSTCWTINAMVYTNQCDSSTAAESNAFAAGWGTGDAESESVANGIEVGPDPSLSPGNYGDYWHEPFWDDAFEFLVRPEYLVFLYTWGDPVLRLIPEKTLTFSREITVAELADCATQDVSCNLLQSSGGPQLTPQEARSALQLDPFYMSPLGQALDPSTLCATSSPAECRAEELQAGAYNEDYYLNTLNYSLASAESSYVDTSDTCTTAAALSAMGDSGIDFKASLKGLSLQGGATIGGSNTTQVSAGITYQSSTITSEGTTLNYGADLGDWDNQWQGALTQSSGENKVCGSTSHPCHACLFAQCPFSPDQDQTRISFNFAAYVDNLFGTLMFQDPGARPRPLDFNKVLGQKLPSIVSRAHALMQRTVPRFQVH